MRPRFVVALLLIAGLPAAAASDATLSFTDTFGQAALHAEGVLEGGDAARMRGYMDQFGNRDGNVTEREARDFVASAKALIGQQVGQVLSGGNTTLDGSPLVGSEMGDLWIPDAAGPVASGPPISFRLNMTFLFQPAIQDTHFLRLHGRPTPAGTLRMTLKAPAGWRVTATEGPAVNQGEGDALTFDMPTAGETLAFSFTKPKGSPAPGPVLLVAIAGALVVRSRRKAADGRQGPP